MTTTIWILIDENENVIATAQENGEDMADLYENQIGGEGHLARRVVKLTLNIDAPKPLELSATVPNDAEGELALTVGY
jgi:hypothetical protein